MRRLQKGQRGLAESINNEEGFISKLWIENSDTEESGGIYLFEDQASAERYVGMHSLRVASMGATDISVKYFLVNEPLSRINRALL